jgi:DNA-binding NarL/FixJ family response regulator
VITVLLVDDDVLVRAGVRMILEAEPDIDVVGEAGSGREAIDLAARHRPDVVLMDIEMQDVDGIEACRTITASNDGVNVVMLTTFQTDEYLFESLRSGASGFLLKRSPPDELLNAVRVVAAGEGLLASSVTVRLIDEFARRAPASGIDRSRVELLTDREIEVLGLVGRGYNNSEIAEATHVSESTAKTHLKRILMKLGLRDRVAAVVFSHETGLVDRDR